MKTFLYNYLLLNIVVVGIAWMLTNDFPGRVYVTAKTEPGLVLQTDCGRGCRFDTAGTAHFWLPNGYFKGDLDLHRRGGGGTAKITTVRVWSRLVFERRWTNPDDLAFDKSGKISLKADTASFGLSRVGWIALLGGELGLLVLAGLFVVLARAARWPAPTVGRRIVSSVVVAVAVAVFCGGIVPLQTLLTNQTELGLSVGSVVLALSWRAALLALVLTALLYWSTRFSDALYLILASAVLVYEYLETGLLTIGCPSLNGDMTYYKDISRMAWDSFVLPAAFVLFLALCRFFRSAVVLVPCAVCILGFASLLDARAPQPDFHPDLAVSFKPKRQVVNETVYSTNRNVLVYVLDCAATPYLQLLLKENPSFAESLTGFTSYTNHLGMFSGTVLSVAGMTTGKYFDDVSKEEQYMYSVYSRDSLLADYLDGSTAVFFNPGSFEKGVSIHAGAVRESGSEYQAASDKSQASTVLQKRMEGQQPWNLSELARFRLMPFCAKYLENVFTVGGWDISGSADNESWAYPRLACAPVADIPLALHWFHTIGMHPPYGVSRAGVDDGRVVDGDAAKLNKLWYVWTLLTDLFTALKTRGIYNSATIIVTADHGYGLSAEDSHISDKSYLSSIARPILLVKPPFAEGAFCESSLPTSHSRLHDLICRARTERLSIQSVNDILRCDARFFCRPDSEKGGFDNFYVDANGNASRRFVPSKGEDPLVKPIELNHRYSFCGDNLKDRPPVRTQNLGFFSVGGGQRTKKGSMQFRLPQSLKGGSCHVEIELNAADGAEISGEADHEILITKKYRHTERILASPDDEGIVTISFVSKGKEYVAIYAFVVR